MEMNYRDFDYMLKNDLDSKENFYGNDVYLDNEGYIVYEYRKFKYGKPGFIKFKFENDNTKHIHIETIGIDFGDITTIYPNMADFINRAYRDYKSLKDKK